MDTFNLINTVINNSTSIVNQLNKDDYTNLYLYKYILHYTKHSNSYIFSTYTPSLYNNISKNAIFLEWFISKSNLHYLILTIPTNDISYMSTIDLHTLIINNSTQIINTIKSLLKLDTSSLNIPIYLYISSEYLSFNKNILLGYIY